ncbi:MAG TPA: polysaccharide deacetylase family protein [Edaphocola sp.]|nr:polysaccharide deacetylase family protein [Edaphocola sp.]
MTSKIAIYAPENTAAPRLLYVLHWLFQEQLQLPYKVFYDGIEWLAAEGFKINYSGEKLSDDALQIIPQGLLSESGVKPQVLAVQRWKRHTVLFYNQPGAELPFDLLAAVFYLLSRYEEYLPHRKDRHGRYCAEQSAAGQYRFLQEPVVDQWLHHFRELLQKKGLGLPKKEFQAEITYDIDMAWQYRHRGALRYWGGHFRDALQRHWKGIRQRWRVVSGKMEDPYFSFPELGLLHQKFDIHPVFFILLGQPGKYDRNIQPEHAAMRQLMTNLSKNYDIGIHPSYGSHESPERLHQEIALLADTVQRPVTKSRQHFIKFSLPETYRRLIEQGITDDYSMGYATHNGFRAGTSQSFYWYDLNQEQTTSLTVHPFAFMDATSKFYWKKSPEETFREWQKLFLKVQAVEGTFISIWHNFILSRGSDWLAMYAKVPEMLRPYSVIFNRGNKQHE